MRNLKQRVEQMEKRLGDQPCAACQKLPRVFIIKNEADEAGKWRKIAEHRAQCTCQTVNHIKTICIDMDSFDPEARRNLEAAKFNGDGKLDLAAANYSSDTVSVLLNTLPFGAAADVIIGGAADSNAYYLRLNEDHTLLEVRKDDSPTGPDAGSYALAKLQSMALSTAQGAATSVLDWANGAPIPQGGLLFDADRLAVRNATVSVVAGKLRPGQIRRTGMAANRGLAAAQNRRPDGSLLDTAQPADAVLVLYVWNGDANLDGLINADDYFLADSGFMTQAKGYSNGDFNYDDVINADDYFLIDSAFIGQSGSLADGEAEPIPTSKPASILQQPQRKKDSGPGILAQLFSSAPVL